MEAIKNLRALYLAKILFEQSDEAHPLSTKQLIETLEKEYGISAHRVTIYEDMEQLRAFGLDIYTVKSTQNKYYLASRLFDLPELKLLIDAVGSSKFITAKKSKELIAKLGQLGSRHSAAELRRNLYAEGRIKPGNEKIYYIVDVIHAAINSGKKSRFRTSGTMDAAASNCATTEKSMCAVRGCWSGTATIITSSRIRTNTGSRRFARIGSQPRREFWMKTPCRCRRISISRGT